MYVYEYHTLAAYGSRLAEPGDVWAAIGPMPGGSIVDEDVRFGAYSISLTVSGTVTLNRYEGFQGANGRRLGIFSLRRRKAPRIGIAARRQVCHLFLSPELFVNAAASFPED